LSIDRLIPHDDDSTTIEPLSNGTRNGFPYRIAIHDTVRPHGRQSDASIAISHAVKRKPYKGRIHRTVRAILSGLR
jgi:hypothetical protein